MNGHPCTLAIRAAKSPSGLTLSMYHAAITVITAICEFLRIRKVCFRILLLPWSDLGQVTTTLSLDFLICKMVIRLFLKVYCEVM
jgi:hypothetical protein